MQQITRSEALDQGLLRYFTGEPCKVGHIAERLTSNRTCCECKLERRHTQVYRDQSNAATKRRRKAEPEPFRRRERNRRARNVDKFRERDRVRYSSGRAETRSVWLAQDRQKRPWVYLLRVHQRNISIKRATPRWLTKDQQESITSVYRSCAKMNMEGSIRYHVDHVVPLGGKNVCGLHVPWNLQIIQAVDNLRKGNRF
jgi:hypothetical protein